MVSSHLFDAALLGVLALTVKVVGSLPENVQDNLVNFHEKEFSERNHPHVLRFTSRKKRNVAQLGYLVDHYTPFSSTQLLKHGNYCGYGGDRNHDGSTIDQCDKCCKTHDNCYDELLGRTTELIGVNEIISNLQFFGPYSMDNKFFLNIGGLPQKSRRCLPYVDLYTFQFPHCSDAGGVCSKRACACDMDFVNCLRRSQCQIQG